MLNIILIICLIILIIIGLANFFKKNKPDEKLVGKFENLSSNLSEVRRDLAFELGQNREELNNSLNQVLDITSRNAVELSEHINSKFDKQFKDLQDSNEKKLDQIQKSVDEKLQETLKQSLSQSFEQVQNQLKSVEQGLGQMRNLASDVGSLSKVMTGVKTRGVIGELQLDRILEEILPQSQYREQENIQDNNRVDFAVILPGKRENEELLLPIDAKFPLDDYQRLLESKEKNDSLEIEKYSKDLLNRIKVFSKDVANKYILPPKTTDFAILFLPTEGLFMEVVNANHGTFIDQIRREFKVNITGPTTMTAVLNSLQMGFKTLQIEKKSNEVFKLLTSVRQEFNNYETALMAVQKDLQKSNNDIDKLLTTRTNMMQRQLKKVDMLEEIN
ncbi:MAG: DNA recombination protein RmuC [Lactovum sp.]